MVLEWLFTVLLIILLITIINIIFYHTIDTMIQKGLTGLLILMIISMGEAAFGTLPLLPTTGTVYTILYYMFIL